MDKQNIHIEKENHSNLVFEDYRIENIDFKINPSFEFNKPIDIDFSINTQISVKKDNSASKINLNCIIFEDAIEKGLPFTMNITISGDFTFNGNLDDDKFIEFCKINGVAVLFPFLRSAITNITSSANLPPLVLPLINLHSITKEVK